MTNQPADAASSDAPVDQVVATPRAPRSVLLDLLRIFAAFWVVVFHWSYLTSTLPDWLYASMRAGYLGVDIFFILSGAVIIHTAVGRTPGEFAFSRFLRLFPVYVAASALVLALLLITGSVSPDPTTWISLTGLQFWLGVPPIIPVAWTLMYEVGFYALIVVLIAVCRNQVTDVRIRLAAALFLVAWLLASATGWEVLQFVTLHQYGPLFVLGVLLGISRDAAGLRRNLPALFVATVLSFHTLLGRTDDGDRSDLARILLSLGVLALSITVILLASMRTPPERPRAVRVFAAITTLSLMTYPIYLLHNEFGFGLTGLLMDSGVPVIASYGVGLGAVLLLSWMSVRVFEPWARRGLRRVTGRSGERSG